MSIKERQEELFKRWCNERPGFCRDGIVCEEFYSDENIKPKILIVLKEANGNNETVDIVPWLKSFEAPGADRIWDNVARWVYGIRHFMVDGEILDWGSVPHANPEFKRNTIKSICAMNLKKVPGGGTTEWRKLEAAAGNNKEFIKQQFGIYDPDLTICANVGDLFMDAMDYGQFGRTTRRGIRWHERESGKYVIDYWHPNYRGPNELLFYGLMDAVAEIYDGDK